MSWTIWAAIIVVAVVIYALVKRWETKLVLLAAGFFLAALSLDPMMAFKQFNDQRRPHRFYLLCDGLCHRRITDQM